MSDTTGRPAADIENDVENTRARVSETIEALRGSMSPNQIMDQVVDYARSSGGSEFIRNLGTSVRDNPLPVMLIGAGIGWLLMSGQNRGSTLPVAASPSAGRPLALPPPHNDGPGLLDRAGAAAVRAKDAVVDAASSATDAVAGSVRTAADTVTDTAASAGSAIHSTMSSATDAAAQLHERASSTTGSVRDSVRRQTHDATHAMSEGYGATAEGANRAGAKIQAGWGKLSLEQPLLVGALGLAVGAALGALLPSTDAENRLMGEASDAVTRQVAETAEEQYEHVKDTVSDNVEQAKDALAGAYADARDTVNKDGLSAHSVGDGVKQAASRVADAVTKSGNDLADAAKSAMADTETRVAGAETPAGSAPKPGTPAPAPHPNTLYTPSIVVPPKV